MNVQIYNIGQSLVDMHDLNNKLIMIGSDFYFILFYFSDMSKINNKNIIQSEI